MSLPLPLAAAADLFVEKFNAYDTVSTKTLGRWNAVKDPDKVISGVIQTDSEKAVSLGSDGALSDGNLMLHTRATVSANDLSQDGQTLTQTYVRYKGEIWKLSTLTNWRDKTENYGKFLLTKYTNIDES